MAKVSRRVNNTHSTYFVIIAKYVKIVPPSQPHLGYTSASIHASSSLLFHYQYITNIQFLYFS